MKTEQVLFALYMTKLEESSFYFREGFWVRDKSLESTSRLLHLELKTNS